MRAQKPRMRTVSSLSRLLPLLLSMTEAKKGSSLFPATPDGFLVAYSPFARFVCDAY